MRVTALGVLGATCFALGVVWPAMEVLRLDCNIHWLHMFATYPDVKGYPMSRSFAQLLSTYFDPHGDLESSCSTELAEYHRDGYPETSSWPLQPRPFTIRTAFDSSPGAERISEHFKGESQNQFRPCDEERPLTTLGVEAIPCAKVNFTEMIERLSPSHPFSAPFQVFNKVLTRNDIAKEQQLLQTAFGTDENITALHKHSGIWPHVVVVMSRDESSVSYYHSHPDYFVVWNIVGVKEWHLLPPAFLPQAQVVWTGLTFMATKEMSAKCVVKVVQNPGDILVVPSWWLHKVGLHQVGLDARSIGHLGYSQHFAPMSSVIGHILNAIEAIFGPSYGAAINLAPSESFFEAVARLRGL